MRLLKLVQAFSTRTIVPVEVEHRVEAFIRTLGVKDEIYFFDDDIQSVSCWATLLHWEYPTAGWRIPRG